MLQRRYLILAAIALAVVVALSCPGAASAQGEDPQGGLSPYWSPAVSQWSPIILQYAQERRLDPDLIAAVIWKESQGRADARSVVGAVGLMQLMPRPGRPSPEDLEDPWTNLFWGARALAFTIRDGYGDLYYSLAAYNGGWEQIHLRVTRAFAADVMIEYARAIAVRQGLPADGNWVAVFAVEGMPGPNAITALGPHRSLVRYTERPGIWMGVPGLPSDSPPSATALVFLDARGVECRVNVWLVPESGFPVASYEEP